MKVSRHHLDITYKQFTGGRYYVITDHSSNGTLVNGRRLQRNESANIPADGSVPYVYLACETNYPLNWDEVTKLIQSKLNADEEMGELEQADGETIYPGGNGWSGNVNGYIPSNESFVDALKLFVTRVIDFKGRSRRKEYWYVQLALFMVSAVLLASFTFHPNTELYWAIQLYSLVVFVPSLSLSVRRLHDTGHNWYPLIGGIVIIPMILLSIFIPFMGLFVGIGALVYGVWLIVLMATDSEPVENEWGPCPK